MPFCDIINQSGQVINILHYSKMCYVLFGLYEKFIKLPQGALITTETKLDHNLSVSNLSKLRVQSY